MSKNLSIEELMEIEKNLESGLESAGLFVVLIAGLFILGLLVGTIR
jgi:hypothetical protein